MKRLVNSLSKYTGLSADQLEEAFEAIQDEVREELEDYFYSTCEVETDHADDGPHYLVHADEFFTFLFENYKVEPR